MTLLNLGCGGQIAHGWVNVDRAFVMAAYPNAETVLLDIVSDEWPWAKGSADAVVLHHVLDLMPSDAMRLVIGRAFETLKLGGVLRMSGADLDLGLIAAIRRDVRFFAEQRDSFEEMVGFFITQGGARRQWLTAEHLIDVCERVGFPHVMRSSYRQSLGPEEVRSLDSRPKESYFVEAIR